jgi:hypothetical protein
MEPNSQYVCEAFACTDRSGRSACGRRLAVGGTAYPLLSVALVDPMLSAMLW